MPRLRFQIIVFSVPFQCSILKETRYYCDVASYYTVTIRTFKDIFVIEFYDNPSMFIDIGIFFYVRPDIFHSFGPSLHSS